jgi:hypothetical protein
MLEPYGRFLKDLLLGGGISWLIYVAEMGTTI